MQYQLQSLFISCALFIILLLSQFIILIHLLLAGKGLVSPFYRRTNWHKDVIKLFGSCLLETLLFLMVLRPFLAEGQGILLQDNFCSPSPESPLSLSLPWWWFGSNMPSASDGGSHQLLLGGEGFARKWFLHIYLKLLCELHDLKRLLSKHSPSQSFRDRHFVLDLFCSDVLWHSPNTGRLEYTFPFGPFNPLPPPEMTKSPKVHFRCMATVRHPTWRRAWPLLNASIIHYRDDSRLDLDWSLWYSRKWLFLAAQYLRPPPRLKGFTVEYRAARATVYDRPWPNLSKRWFYQDASSMWAEFCHFWFTLESPGLEHCQPATKLFTQRMHGWCRDDETKMDSGQSWARNPAVDAVSIGGVRLLLPPGSLCLRSVY